MERRVRWAEAREGSRGSSLRYCVGERWEHLQIHTVRSTLCEMGRGERGVQRQPLEVLCGGGEGEHLQIHTVWRAIMDHLDIHSDRDGPSPPYQALTCSMKSTLALRRSSQASPPSPAG